MLNIKVCMQNYTKQSLAYKTNLLKKAILKTHKIKILNIPNVPNAK